ncbi:hypothetical protein J1N35_015417, partial [Gossypium stocksii]
MSATSRSTVSTASLSTVLCRIRKACGGLLHLGFPSGLRALVKTGPGTRVTPYVDDSIVINFNPVKEALCPECVRWLRERNLSSDDRVMRMKEG